MCTQPADVFTCQAMTVTCKARGLHATPGGQFQPLGRGLRGDRGVRADQTQRLWKRNSLSWAPPWSPLKQASKLPSVSSTPSCCKLPPLAALIKSAGHICIIWQFLLSRSTNWTGKRWVKLCPAPHLHALQCLGLDFSCAVIMSASDTFCGCSEAAQLPQPSLALNCVGGSSSAAIAKTLRLACTSVKSACTLPQKIIAQNCA